uniref:Putative esterase and lipase n=2 Tax=Ixodes ricinus TaxID=34613 RepID=V5H8H4_IXORI
MAATQNWMWILCSIAVFLATLHVGHFQESSSRDVSTSYGRVRGDLVQALLPDLVTSVQVYAFRGIRYARPPLGWRRFELPERPEPWSDSSYFQSTRRHCLQWSSYPENRVIGEEDCLYLDIYVPQTAFATSTTKLPVVVFIPGPDFKSGGKDYIAPGLGYGNTNIFVVLNYRLGVLGFLSTEDEHAKGNLGLWDQQMALTFVKENIERFQGDTSRITLMGFGAGAMSVSFHMLNPVSSGLFTRAIMSGGSATSPDATVEDAWRQSRELGQAVGCSYYDSYKLIDCLRGIQASKLVEKAHYSKLKFAPIVDVNVTQNAFLRDHPRLLYAGNHFTPKPTIYGYTKQAGSLRYFEKFQEIPNSKSIDDIVRTYLNEYFTDEDSRVGITAAVKFQYYRPRSNAANATRNAINTIRMLSDFLVGAPVEAALSAHLRLLSSASTSYLTTNQAYFYIFGIPNGARTFADPQKAPREQYGATYMDDMLYTVNTEGILQVTNPVLDRPVVAIMNTFFTTFINGLNPGGTLYAAVNPAAPQYVNMTRISPAGVLDPVPYRQQEMAFWNIFVPDLHVELNRTSWTSYHRAVEATHFKNATWGTTTLVVLLVLIIVGLLAAFFVYRRQKKQTRVLNKREGIEFRAASQDVKL